MATLNWMKELEDGCVDEYVGGQISFSHQHCALLSSFLHFGLSCLTEPTLSSSPRVYLFDVFSG